MGTIEENIACRKEANEVFAELLDLIPLFEHSEKPRFWEVMLELVKEKAPKPIESKPPFTDAEARKFLTYHRMPYGKYADEFLDQIPASYIAWIAQGDEFTRELQRLVASDWFKRRLAREQEAQEDEAATS